MMNFFGGPFRGKTTAAGLCKSHGIAVWETDEERAKLPGWNEQLWQAWKIDHPLHHEWERLNKIHQWNKSTARKRRFITFSHDPSTETENVLLYVGPSQLARIQGRPEKYGHARVEASKHWEAKASRAGWTQFYPSALFYNCPCHGAGVAISPEGRDRSIVFLDFNLLRTLQVGTGPIRERNENTGDHLTEQHG
jgi:hypothetical protein